MQTNTTLVNTTINLNSTGLARNGGQASSTILMTLMGGFTFFSMVATISLNGLVVLVYFVFKELRTPFNAYIVNICLAEALLACNTIPGYLIRNHIGPGSDNAVICSLFVYFSTILATAARYGHALVSANRIWAVTFPHSYRTAHTNRFARCLIGGTYVWLNVVLLPYIIYGRVAMHMGLADPSCHVETSHQVALAVAAEIVAFDLPHLFIFVTFPYIMWKLHSRRFRAVKTAKPVTAVLVVSSGVLSVAPDQPALSISVPGKDDLRGDKTCLVPAALPLIIGANNQRSHQGSGSANAVLVFFVIGTIICWTPNTVYFLIVDISRNYWNTTFNFIQFCLQYTYSWVNPILCYIATRKLREAINCVLRCRPRDFRGSS